MHINGRFWMSQHFNRCNMNKFWLFPGSTSTVLNKVSYRCLNNRFIWHIYFKYSHLVLCVRLFLTPRSFFPLNSTARFSWSAWQTRTFKGSHLTFLSRFSPPFSPLPHFVPDHPVRHLSVTVSLMNADVSIRGGYYTIKMFQWNSVCGVIGSV